MKKILSVLLLTACFFAQDLFAQDKCNSAVITTSPVVFTAEDEVTIRADVSSCPGLSGQSQLWLWMFVPDCCAPVFGNDASGGASDFCNSNDMLAMTNVEGDIWEYTFTPVTLFDRSPSEITQIGFIPKVNGCPGDPGQTEDLFLTVAPSIFIPTELRSFPATVFQNDFITAYFDQTLTENTAMSELSEIFVYTWATRTDAEGNSKPDAEAVPWPEVGNTPSLQTLDEGNGIFSLTVFPQDRYPLDEGDIVTGFNFIFRNAEGTAQAETLTVVPVTSN